jgi:pimeloyl-ACP methyl ester carboxylesterase
VTTQHRLDVRDGQFEVTLHEAGAGGPLLYLHSEFGLRWTRFHDLLAERYRVLAPTHPGFGGSTGIEHLRDVHDAIYFYLDLLDHLELSGLPLVGHGLGGMFAAELAAVQPERFTHVVLLAPFGLWLVDAPTLDFFAVQPAELAAALYADPTAAAALAAAAAPADQEALIAQALDRASSLASAATYLWPIPNRGLGKRLHRVRAPTLLVWGDQDRVVPPRHAEAFRERIPNARLELIPQAGHLPEQEQPESLAALTLGFLETLPVSSPTLVPR